MTEPTAELPPQMTAELPATEPAGPSRGRAVAAVICLVLAGLLTIPAGVAYWGQRTLNDTERYVRTVGPLVDSPEVQDAIATKITAAIQEQVDVESVVRSAFTGLNADLPRLDRLVGPISAAVNGFIDRQVRTFVASDAFSEFWVAANTRAQQVLYRVLTGDDTGPIALQGDQIVLDVSDAIDEVKAQLVAGGITFIDRVPLPAVDRQIVLMDAPQVRQMRTIYAFSNPVAIWLWPVVGLLYLMSWLLARRRARMAVWIGAIGTANALLLSLVLSIGQQLFVNELAGTTFGPASRVFYNTLLVYLDQGKDVMLRLGLVVLVAGLLAGATRWGNSVRSSVAGVLEDAGSQVSVERITGAGAWVRANAAWLRLVAVALGFVVLLWGDTMNVERFRWALVLVLAALAAIQVLIGTGRRVDLQANASNSA